MARRLVDALYAGAPTQSGSRVNHARGVLVEGRFRPASDAGLLSRAATFAGPEQTVLARFSSSTGDAHIAEDDPRADPRGLAIRIGDDPGMTLVGHTADAFPARDPEEFLSFLESLNARGEDPERLDRHVREHIAAGRFDAALSRRPSSFAATRYHMLHPYRLTRRDGRETVGRLSIAGASDRPAPDGPTGQGPNYLDRELKDRLAGGPAELLLSFEPAPAGVEVEDVSAPWPDRGEATVLGRVFIDRVAPDQALQRTIFFDPSELPRGITFAGDPMIEARIRAYRLAAARRRGDV